MKVKARSGAALETRHRGVAKPRAPAERARAETSGLGVAPGSLGTKALQERQPWPPFSNSRSHPRRAFSCRSPYAQAAVRSTSCRGLRTSLWAPSCREKGVSWPRCPRSLSRDADLPAPSSAVNPFPLLHFNFSASFGVRWTWLLISGARGSPAAFLFKLLSPSSRLHWAGLKRPSQVARILPQTPPPSSSRALDNRMQSRCCKQST